MPAIAAAQPSDSSAGAWTARQASRFWTPARMRRAQPVEVHPHASAPSAQAFAAATPGGTPLRVPARAARPVAPGSSFEEVIDPTTPVSRENGVIFFEADGGFGRCSGTSVNAPNRSVVLTAGHCVNSGGGHGEWYRGRWAFVPGYRYGQRPFGVFAAKWLDSTPRWLGEGSENADVGAAVVMRNERGETLAEAVGGAGFASGLKPDQVFDIHGYPVAPPFDGETQRLCPQTPFLGHDPLSFSQGGPLGLAVACSVTGGASGGGWTIAGNRINGVTDYGYPEDPATDFGSYFGKEVARLYHRAARVR